VAIWMVIGIVVGLVLRSRSDSRISELGEAVAEA
jgi:hypothetical protein